MFSRSLIPRNLFGAKVTCSLVSFIECFQADTTSSATLSNWVCSSWQGITAFISASESFSIVSQETSSSQLSEENIDSKVLIIKPLEYTLPKG